VLTPSCRPEVKNVRKTEKQQKAGGTTTPRAQIKTTIANISCKHKLQILIANID
jgi:hypothetical protein